MPFTLSTDNIKYFGVSLNKQTKTCKDKNFKYFMKEI